MKAFIKKQTASLKRAPQRIPQLILVVCCIIYTFNLTAHSNASIYVTSEIVALYVFIITLSSILAIFSYINAYSGGKRRIRTLIVAVVLVLLQIVLDVFYINIMYYETIYKVNPVPVNTDIANSMNMTMVHIGALVVALAAIFLKPVYHKALLRINTSVLDVEDSNISDTTSIDEEFPDEDELDM